MATGSKLTRVRFVIGAGEERTLHFTYPGGAKSRRSRVTFVAPENVPAKVTRPGSRSRK